MLSRERTTALPEIKKKKKEIILLLGGVDLNKVMAWGGHPAQQTWGQCWSQSLSLVASSSLLTQVTWEDFRNGFEFVQSLHFIGFGLLFCTALRSVGPGAKQECLS